MTRARDLKTIKPNDIIINDIKVNVLRCKVSIGNTEKKIKGNDSHTEKLPHKTPCFIVINIPSKGGKYKQSPRKGHLDINIAFLRPTYHSN